MTNTDQVSIMFVTSIAYKSYQGVTCHAILDWEYASWVIGVIRVTKRHTAETIKTDIAMVLHEWTFMGKLPLH